MTDASAPGDNAGGADQEDDAMEVDETAEAEEGSDSAANGNGSGSGA